MRIAATLMTVAAIVLIARIGGTPSSAEATDVAPPSWVGMHVVQDGLSSPEGDLVAVGDLVVSRPGTAR